MYPKGHYSYQTGLKFIKYSTSTPRILQDFNPGKEYILLINSKFLST